MSEPSVVECSPATLADGSERTAYKQREVEGAWWQSELQEQYKVAAPQKRRMLTPYERLWVYEDRIADQTFGASFDELIKARRVKHKKADTFVLSLSVLRTGLLVAALLAGDRVWQPWWS